MRKRKKLTVALVLLLAGYLASYLWLSRSGYYFGKKEAHKPGAPATGRRRSRDGASRR